MRPVRKVLDRVLWISDVFPRPHKMTDGVWSLKTALAIQRKGVEVVVLSPTPWIPKWLAFTPALKDWSDVPHAHDIEGLKVFYPKCPHYPKRLVRYSLYKHFPFFETSAVYHWVERTVSVLMDSYPFQLVHTNFMFPSGYLGYRIKKRYGIPFVFHERGTRRLEMASETRSLREIYSRVLEQSDSVIVLNSKMADIIRHRFHYEGKVGLIRDGGDVSISEGLSHPRPEKYRDRKIVLSVGTYLERKGHDYLIKAVGKARNRVPEIKCIIIGSGKREKVIRKLINGLGLDDTVELLGEVPHDEVLRTMSWCDVFALPSWDEAFGTVYGEAMTFGKPVIACTGEGIGDVIQDGVEGLLVRKQDVDSLAEALVRILTESAFALGMGARAKELAERELNYNSISSRIIDLYRGVLQ